MIIIFFTLVQYKLYLYIQPYQDKANELDSEQGGLLSDLIINNTTVKSFATEKKEQERYGKLNHTAAKAKRIQYYKSIWILGTAGFVSSFLEV